MVNSRAMTTYPAAQARPAVMTRKMAEISLALPATDRNRTREKAPATAMPVPTLPLTMRITVHTTIGSTTREIKNPLLASPDFPMMKEATRPQMPAAARQARNMVTEKPSDRMESKIADILHRSFRGGFGWDRRFGQGIQVCRAVLRKGSGPDLKRV